MKIKTILTMVAVSLFLVGCGEKKESSKITAPENNNEMITQKEDSDKTNQNNVTEKKEEVLDSDIEDMIAARQQARKDKNFALADEIRGKLLDMGIVLEDTREGVKWKRV